ncbi:M56 family metallopeptidase [Peristeroidobacter agariperforans]|uniref:M56 family metallopeptidase n=1 Tax=Peristeroidobacter agariperforans TaxID=268404 RepID=UPI00101B86B6|nr:M56 family metallopeptidase [Peristeroidobacter agariperforans]
MTALALHLWQSTVILIAAWLLTRVCRRNSAEIRYWIWFCASLKFLVPFSLLQQLGDYVGRSLPAPIQVAPSLLETGSAIFVPSIDGSGFDGSVLPKLTMVAVTIWALGSAALLLRWLSQWLAMRSMLSSAPYLPMGLDIPVRVTSAGLTPGVFGVFRPVLILPRAVMRELSASQIETVLAHEMCHIRRRDNLTAAIHKLIEVIFWFHPLVWWIGANLLREREAACDESVVEAGHEQVVYAESLLHVCRLGVTARFAGVAASSGGDLKQRMTSILSPERASPLDQLRFMLLLTVAMALCYGPVLAGVVTGAAREASDGGRIYFETITLTPSQPLWWQGSKFDPAGQLSLDNVSLRDLIALAYPASYVNGDPELIDRIHYDVHARWRPDSLASERGVYRELLKNILRTNSSLQLYVKQGCDIDCAWIPGELVAGRSYR